ncbi:MAG: hypothetical protein ACOCZ6_04320 [Nanoarchaeota archaeon]
MKRFNKKAIQLNLWTLVSMLILILLIFALFFFLQDVRENTFFERNVLAKDLSLTMNAIQGMPGDVYFNYESNLLNMFNITFEENKALVKDGRRENYYLFYVTKGFSDDYKGDFEQPDDLSFTKASSILKIEEGFFSFVEEENCPQAEGKKINDEGLVFLHPLREDSREFAVKIEEGITPASRVYDEITGSEADLPVLVAVDIKDEMDESVNIYYLNHDRNSRSLACFLHNEMLDSDSFREVRYTSGTGLDIARVDSYVSILIEAGEGASPRLIVNRINRAFDKYDENLQ